ncbi:MAG: pyridoxamine 5'-phosphate oxidase family protein [Candidatus Aminicenantes bacterium]|nr:pyridoxamine 5'-phosphate oxidase family protein [Candidatus Aminicenantes bacterium]
MTKYHMFKKEKEITDVEVLTDVLKKGQYASIALCEKNNPYIVTMNYGFEADKKALYFHCALKGLKLEILSKNPRVCATVMEDHGYKRDECSHAYRSIVFWGTLRVVQELKEKKYGMEVLFRHLETNPDPIRERNFKTERDYAKVNILRLDIEEITGKQGR